MNVQDAIVNIQRRHFLQRAGGGIGMLALQYLLQRDAHATTVDDASTKPHFAPRAKRMIWLFMHGGPSHVDLLDPKPDLLKYSGKALPESFGPVMTRRAVAKNPLLAPIRKFRKRGQSGLEVSDFLPNIANLADDLCVVRSLHGDSVNHPQSVYQMNTGSVLMGHPSFGSWLAYGLGSENANMPAFVVLPDPGGGLKGGPPAWGNGFLPGKYQGTTMRPGKTPILNLAPQSMISSAQQRSQFELLQQLNENHLRSRPDDDNLSSRMKAYELAFRMQTTAPEVVDFSQESEETKRLYGIDRQVTRDYGMRCLLARRMIERGVRFVQVYSGDTNGWDAHNNVDKNHSLYCEKTDQPIAALLIDLKRRGLLDDTLVVWCGEFGRMPMSEQGTGRDHNPWGYCGWLAGAGISGGRSYGATDAIGLRAEEKKVHVRQLHATLLHLMGLDNNLLSYSHNGLDERLTGPEHIEPVKGLLA
ncbi:MAG: DUF1501 domain-containing protein [Planctomycetales bacterium]|nr:DUF1501 domain-containing protein [Planctomycetales bacterium]